MDGILRAAIVLCVASCGPRVIVPGEDEGGDASDGMPQPSTTGGNVPPSVTIGTAPMPVTSGITDPYDPTTTDGSFYPDWGLPGADTGSCAMWASEGCADLPAPNAEVVGDTPLGTFDTSYAVFASEGCFGSCVETTNVGRVVLVDSPVDVPEDATPEEGIVVEAFVYDRLEDEPVEAFVTVVRDGESAGEWGVMHIPVLPDPSEIADPFDPATAAFVQGSFAVDAPGWSLRGTFEAAYCPALNLLAVCD
jgi:hypothetical protein